METERLVIRNFKADDWYDLFEYLSQKEVLRYEPRTESNEEECKKIAAERAQGNIFWAVCLKETGKMIGHLYFAQREPYDYLTWMLGYIFNPAYYGQGYATEACRKMLQYAFEQLDAHRVIALCNPENTASWRLLERLSMRREGHFRKEVFFRKTDDGNPIWLDGFQYAILAEEWNKERNNNLIFEPIIEASSLATKFSY
ncbi:GNAT family N-acetyltransferase [Methylomusa anaerophila]|uniref:GNAT family N-acetyltransferase n=1 Tax=Methylomusa anaerophila TaxID=1930071 RepID=UPI0018D51180|nr:GNAT family protein [Methylomusa anaerophila]